MVGGNNMNTGDSSTTDQVKSLPTSSDGKVERTTTPSLYRETPELSEQAERLCESDEEDIYGGLGREIVNGENFLVQGEMTIREEIATPAVVDAPAAVVANPIIPRHNPLLSRPTRPPPPRPPPPPPPHLRPPAPHGGEAMYHMSRADPRLYKQSSVTSLRKGYDVRRVQAMTTQKKATVVEVDEPCEVTVSQKSTFIYSPTTYSKARALMETEPSNLHVKPGSNLYGTRRPQEHNPSRKIQRPLLRKPALEQQNNSNSRGHPARVSVQRSPVQSPSRPVLHATSKISPGKRRMDNTVSRQSQSVSSSPRMSQHQQQSPVRQRRPSCSPVQGEPGASVCTIDLDPDPTVMPQGSNDKMVRGEGGKLIRERTGNLSLLDEDVFEYTPTPPNSSTSPCEKLVKNEDRYSKYELAKMTNEKHKKLHQKTAELNEKAKELKEVEKKMSRMKVSVAKLSNELKEKNRILEKQSTELLDLEGSKSDCEIYIKKLKEDLAESQRKLEAKVKDLEGANARADYSENLLEEQRRLHRNLTQAHNTSLKKIKDLNEDKNKAELLHIAQIQDKDVLIKKLEQGLAQKMETVNGLIRDKRVIEDLLLKARNEKSGSILTFKAPAEPAVISIDSSQATTPKFPMIKAEDVSIADNKIASPSPKKRKRKLSAKKLAEDTSSKSPLSTKNPKMGRRLSKTPNSNTDVEGGGGGVTISVDTLHASDHSALDTTAEDIGDTLHIVETDDPPNSSQDTSILDDAIEDVTAHESSPGLPVTFSTPRRRDSSSSTTCDTKRKRSRGFTRRKGSRKCPIDNGDRSEQCTPPPLPHDTTGKRKRKATKRYSPKTQCKDEDGMESDSQSSKLELDASQPTVTAESREENVDDTVCHSVVDSIVTETGDGCEHPERHKFMVTAIEYKSSEREDEVGIDTPSRPNTNDIEVPSYRKMSDLMLIHEEGEQSESFSKVKETDSIANYTRMHKKCEAAEVRMMRQCERLRTKLEQRNKKKKVKELDIVENKITRYLHCRNPDHSVSIEKRTEPYISIFRCPLPPLKQKDFSLPWASEIKSFAYYAKPASCRGVPDSTVTLNPTPSTESETPFTPTPSQITLTISASSVKSEPEPLTKDQISTKICPANSDSSPTSNSTTLKSTNIWANIQTSITSGLESTLGRNFFSKMNIIRNPSTSSESSSRDASVENNTACKRDLLSSCALGCDTKLVKSERRNLWDDWCSKKVNPNATEKPIPDSERLSPTKASATTKSHVVQSVEQKSSAEGPTSIKLEPPDCYSDVSSDALEMSVDSGAFDQKSFLLDARTSTGETQNLRPQPLTRKLEKLSKNKRPVLVCTNSSPRPSDDSFEESPAPTS